LTEKKPDLSIVVPVYNEAENLEVLHASLKTVLKSIQLTHEIVFVDDGSTDGTFDVVRYLYEKDTTVRGFSFSRNFGHQVALFAGLGQAKGDIVISMDGDMQHPPALIPDLLKKYEEGFDIVNTKRIDSKSTGLFKRLSSRWYYGMLNALSDVPIEPAAESG